MSSFPVVMTASARNSVNSSMKPVTASLLVADGTGGRYDTVMIQIPHGLSLLCSNDSNTEVFMSFRLQVFLWMMPTSPPLPAVMGICFTEYPDCVTAARLVLSFGFHSTKFQSYKQIKNFSRIYALIIMLFYHYTLTLHLTVQVSIVIRILHMYYSYFVHVNITISIMLEAAEQCRECCLVLKSVCSFTTITTWHSC